MRSITVQQYRRGLYLVMAGLVALLLMPPAYQVCFPSRPIEKSLKKGANAERGADIALVEASLPNSETQSVPWPDEPDAEINLPEEEAEPTDTEVTSEPSSVRQEPTSFDKEMNELTEDDVRRVTGVNWSIVRFHEGRNIVAKLARPYPSQSSETEAAGGTTARVRAIGEKEALEISSSFLQDNKSIFEIDDSTEFGAIEVTKYEYPTEYAERGYDYIVDLPQVFHDIPVLDGKAKVVLDACGEVFMVKNSLFQITCVSVVPSIAPELAISIAQQYLRTDIVPDEKLDLCIFPPDKLCWRINFYDPVFREVFVEAVEGTLVQDRPNVLK